MAFCHHDRNLLFLKTCLFPARLIGWSAFTNCTPLAVVLAGVRSGGAPASPGLRAAAPTPYRRLPSSTRGHSVPELGFCDNPDPEGVISDLLDAVQERFGATALGLGRVLRRRWMGPKIAFESVPR